MKVGACIDDCEGVAALARKFYDVNKAAYWRVKHQRGIANGVTAWAIMAKCWNEAIADGKSFSRHNARSGAYGMKIWRSIAWRICARVN
jgi:hypothetical protein